MYLRQQHAVMMQHITISSSSIIIAIPAIIAIAVEERPRMMPSSFWLPLTVVEKGGTISDNT